MLLMIVPLPPPKCQDDRCATTPILKSYKVTRVSVGTVHAFPHVPQTSMGGSERASNSSIFPLCGQKSTLYPGVSDPT